MPFGMKMPSCEIKIKGPACEVENQAPACEVEIKAPACEVEIKAPSCECEVSLECDIKVKPPHVGGGKKGKMSGDCLSIDIPTTSFPTLLPHSLAPLLLYLLRQYTCDLNPHCLRCRSPQPCLTISLHGRSQISLPELPVGEGTIAQTIRKGGQGWRAGKVTYSSKANRGGRVE